MSTATTSPRRRHPDPSSKPTTADEPAPRSSLATAAATTTTTDHPMPRPTHFLALPISHHPELLSAISALTSSWLAHDPPIDGLDLSIVIQPRRLHLTLGVMALTPPLLPPPDRNSNDDSDGDSEHAPRRCDGAPCQPRPAHLHGTRPQSTARAAWPAGHHAAGPCARTCALPRAGPPLSRRPWSKPWQCGATPCSYEPQCRCVIHPLLIYPWAHFFWILCIIPIAGFIWHWLCAVRTFLSCGHLPSPCLCTSFYFSFSDALTLINPIKFKSLDGSSCIGERVTTYKKMTRFT
jgi:hypothetical protein